MTGNWSESLDWIIYFLANNFDIEREKILLEILGGPEFHKLFFCSTALSLCDFRNKVAWYFHSDLNARSRGYDIKRKIHGGFYACKHFSALYSLYILL